MKTITANVFYPVFGVEVEVPDNATDSFIREVLINVADGIMESTSIDPYIVDCNESKLNDPIGISLE